MDESEISVKIQCLSCQHNLKMSSCSACVSKGIDAIEKIELLNENPNKIAQKLDTYRYSCKIAINDTAEFENIDPLNCKFYFPKYLKIHK